MEVFRFCKGNMALCIAFLLPCALFSQKWFLNDANQKGDVFTSTIGRSSNSGKTSDAPTNSLSYIFQNAKKGDTVYIDNGTYPEISATGSILIPQPEGITIVFPKTEVLEKNNLPENVKATAEEFYILNDKPVSREEYLKAKSKL
ncbi:MAG: hypothetical protein RI952_1715 [Bacteroidota bacterium]|jgi:hypothetical protein